MRRKLVLGLGLAALFGGSAPGQFAVDRVQPKVTPGVPGGLTPVAPASPAPAAPAPVVGGYQPTAPAASPGAPLSSPTGSLYTPTYSSPPPPPAYVPPVEAPRSTYGSPAPTLAPTPAPSIAALPVNIEIPTALPKDHPWLLKADHGPYFIMVKSYVRPSADSRAATDARERGEKALSARDLAEGLASEIRNTYRVQALLFEYISEERKAEIRAQIIARQQAETQYMAQVHAMEQKAKLSGLDFIEPDKKLRMRKHDGTDQIGVLIGGFKTEADAIKALATLKTWPRPKNTDLLDKGILRIRNDEDRRQEFNGSDYMNPYETAFVVPNPAVARAATPAAQHGLDPFVVKLNEGRPYNLLKATKGWTLAVKAFSAPVELAGRDGTSPLGPKLFGGGFGSKGVDVLAASAEQAEALAKALRSINRGPNGEVLNLEAFVMHTRTASIVTVGQFDSPDDPALLAMKRVLSGMQAKMSKDQVGLLPVEKAPPLFDNVLPIPIPK